MCVGYMQILCHFINIEHQVDFGVHPWGVLEPIPWGYWETSVYNIYTHIHI